MAATVIYMKHCLVPQNREVLALEKRKSIAELAPEWDRGFVAIYNGNAVLRKDWDLIIDIDASTLAFVDVAMIPQGGGGSNPLTMILQIAVVALSMAVPGMLGLTYASMYTMEGALAFAGGVTTMGAIASGVTLFAGMMLVNAVIPPATQSISNYNVPTPSPTYTISAQGNSARIEGAIPEQFGYHTAYPDFAAMPYQEYSGNEQYVYSLLCLGRGQYDIEGIFLEDTPLSNFEEVTYEVVQPNGTVSLFPANVVTSVEVTGQDLATSSYVGGFIANAPETTANYISFDLVAPRGIFYANDSGGLNSVSISLQLEYRQVNDVGTPLTGWTVQTVTYSGATTTAQRYSEKYQVTAGRYECRVMRTDTEQTDSRYGHDIVWAGLRAYLNDTKTYGDATLVAVKMRSSSQLSGVSSRKIRIVSTRKLPIYNGSSWSANTATRSIAWALAYVCKQYGLTDSQYDLATLRSLDSVWAARGDECNGRMDNFTSFWDALTKIGAAGRCKPYMQGGVVRFFRDQAASIPVAMYSMRNIIKGSFSIDYLMPTTDTADAVEVGYFDALVWAQRKVQAKLPGSTASNPAKMEISFVTDRDQAYREGIYQAACNRYRRKMITLSTEMEGFIPSFGDLIVVQHDMPAWGQSGEIVKSEISGNALMRSEDITSWIFMACKAVGSGSLSNTIIAPDGETTADFICEDTTTNANHWVRRIITPAPANDTIVTASGYFKAGTRSKCAIYVARKTDTVSYLYGKFDLTNCTVLSVGTSTPTTATITPIGNGWYRCSVTGSIGSGSSNVVFNWSLLNDAGANVYTGDGVSGLYVWGAQFDNSETLRPYIKTDADVRNSVTVLTTSENLEWQLGQTHYAGIRRLDGSIFGPILVKKANASPNMMDFESAPDFSVYTGGDYERTHYTFGWGETWGQKARVVSVAPKGMYQVEIKAINEDSSVHTAETGLTTPSPVTSQIAKMATAPSVSGLIVSPLYGDSTKITASWTPSAWADHYAVEIRSSSSTTWSRVGEPSVSSFTFVNPYGNGAVIRVAAVGLTQGAWKQVVYTDPNWTTWSNGVQGFSVVAGVQNYLKWTALNHIYVAGYRIRNSSGTVITETTGTTYNIPPQTVGSKTWYINAIDKNGYECPTRASASYTFTAPSAPTVSASFEIDNCILSWTIPAGTQQITGYEVRVDGTSWATATSIGQTDSTTFKVKGTWSGPKTFWVSAIDSAGNVGVSGSTSATVVIPSAPTITTQVIDNNILLYWTDAKQTLPIVNYEIRRGATYAGATVVGTKQGLFTALFESTGGSYTYWVVGIDSAGNYGTPASIAATVAQPPDYVLYSDFYSTLNGTLSNAFIENGCVIAPINATETVAQHFDNHSWTTAQAQIDAGYPIYIQPALTSGYYEETIDYGTILGSYKITANPTYATLSGSPAVSCTISVKTNIGDAWTDYSGVNQVYVSNFRYVKIKLTVTSNGGTGLVSISGLNVKLDARQKTRSSSITANAADSGGTVVYLTDNYLDTGNKVFVDVQSINVTAKGTTPVIALYDFVDTPYPLSFKILLFNTSGARVSGTVDYTVRGV